MRNWRVSSVCYAECFLTRRYKKHEVNWIDELKLYNLSPLGKILNLLLSCPSLFPSFPVQFSSVQSLSRVQLFATPWIAACQASLFITNSWSLLKLMSTELVMPSNHLILCRPLLLRPSIFPSMRVFSNESVLRIRWPKYWSFNLNISPSIEFSGLISLTISNQLYSSIKFKNFKCTISNDFNVFNNL